MSHPREWSDHTIGQLRGSPTQMGRIARRELRRRLELEMGTNSPTTINLQKETNR